MITKTPPALAPNLSDVESVRDKFTWSDARKLLAGLPGGGGLNMAYEAVGRQVAEGRGEQVAIRWLGKRGERAAITYAELLASSSRFANVLATLGVEPEQRVFSLAGRIPALYVAALGTLAHRAVFCPLFSAFGPEPIAQRLGAGRGRVLVTTAALYRKKVASLRERLPDLEHVLIVGGDVPDDCLDFEQLLARASPEHAIAPTAPDAPALLHFTSGTTGMPKGALHVHEAVVMHHLTGRWALDLRPGDVYWCTADPGWVTGTSYGIVAPLSNGVTMIVDEAELDPERWYQTLERERVTVWYTAPTAIRMLIKAGDELPKRFNLSRVRFAASVGEPLPPQAVCWGADVLGFPFHDNWWQTETGGIVIANLAALPILPGSMGRPLPGIDAAIVRRDEQGHVRVIDEPDVQGELALRAGWPSLFRAYVGMPERYAKCFAEGWYLSGDLARRDADGNFWFVGRADDVIKSAGHLIGPFEVESVLLEHPAVADAGVIGVPDPIAMEVVKAFLVLRQGYEASDALQRDILGYSRKRLGPAVAPRQIAFTTSLPKTRSGKVLRRLLRARELGLPEGDTSTLEGAP